MTILESRLIRLAFAAVATMSAMLAKAQQTPPPSPLMQSANIPLPPGPFASWPPENREPAIRSLRFRCMFIGGMAFDNYHGPKEAAAKDIMAFISACVVKQMPDDWPGQAGEREKAMSSYESAKQLDPNVPDPNLLAGALGR